MLVIVDWMAIGSDTHLGVSVWLDSTSWKQFKMKSVSDWW